MLQLEGFRISFVIRDIFKYVTDESLQNKKKIGESSKKEAGVDVKHDFSFTWPK